MSVLSERQALAADTAVTIARRVLDGLAQSKGLLHQDRVALATACLPALLAQVDLCQPPGSMDPSLEQSLVSRQA